jgi:bifunctional DNase/RNase
MSEGHDQHVVVLKERDGDRQFPILIGMYEVYAIHRTVNDRPPPRPMTHELFGNVLHSLDVTIEKVIVNDLKQNTFYARLMLRQDGKTYDVDSRPSDAIALAVQTGAPIFVEEAVLEGATRGL